MKPHATQQQRQAASDFLKGCLKGLRPREIAMHLHATPSAINKARRMLQYENGTYYTSSQLVFDILKWRDEPIKRT